MNDQIFGQSIGPVTGHSDASSEPDSGDESSVAVAVSKPKTKEPARFAVILLNDDYTTMEFVVEILVEIFQKTPEQAAQIMLHVHQKGRGVAGIYSHEIAETKVAQVEQEAQLKGYPLKCILEKV